MKVNLLKAVIIEDEQESLDLLQNLLISTGLVEVPGSTTDSSMASDIILTYKPDLLFLDIKMPGKDGFEIIDDLRKMKSVNPHVVFTTAYDEYAVKAFEYAAFDYLLKPVEPKRLHDTIIRFIDNRQSGNEQSHERLVEPYKKLMFRNTSGVIFIDQNEVVFIEAAGNYSIIHMSNNRTETVTSLIARVEEQLSSDKFFRISRSFIINLDSLKKISTRQLQCILIKNGIEFKCDISRDRIGDLVERMRHR